MKFPASSFATVGLLLSMSIACSDQSTVSSNVSPGTEPRSGTLKERIVPILNQNDRLSRIEALISELRAIPDSEVGELQPLLRDVQIRFRELERVLLIARWAEVDHVAATDWAIRGETKHARSVAIEEAVQAWARVDPEGFIQAYDVTTYAAGEPSMLTGLIYGWFDSGVKGLDHFVFSLTQEELRMRAFKDLARVHILRTGGEASIAWATATQNKARLNREVAAEIARIDDPELAVEWCDRVCSRAEGSLMSQEIARTWGRRDGHKMMDWLITLPDVQSTWVAARIGYRQFVIEDEEGAYAWLEETTRDQRRTGILQGPVSMYIRKQTHHEPLVALEWAGYLTEDLVRRNAQISIVRRWRKEDPEAAMAWLEASDLNEHDREQSLLDSPREGARRAAAGK